MYWFHSNTKLTRLFLILLLFKLSNAIAQENSVKIKLSGYYECSGNIFKADYDPWFRLRNAKLRFTPNSKEIQNAEEIFIRTYNQVRKKDKSFLNFQPLKSPKRFFYKWRRNYLGYIDEAGDKIIVIHLLNFRKERQALENYPEWGKQFIVGFGDWFEANQTELTAVNLARKTAEVY